MNNSYIKINRYDATEVYIWRDERGYVQTDIWVFQQPGWTVYGVSETTGYIYFLLPNR
jgi:hypothetical protein